MSSRIYLKLYTRLYLLKINKQEYRDRFFVLLMRKKRNASEEEDEN
jgi:hypothetical protein